MAPNTTHRKPRRRKSYAARTGMDARSSKIIVNAMFGKQPEFSEDEDGNLIRKWLLSESSSYSNADLASCLRNRVAVEANEMLGTVPPSAIKYCVTKGWLIPKGALFLVTRRAAIDLNLPLRFRGTHLNGRKIPFAAAPERKA